MEIDKYKAEDGVGFTHNDMDYHTEEDLIMSGMLGFCGCGNPDNCLKYILDVLTHIDKSIKGMPNEEWHKQRQELFQGNEGAMYFIYYVLDEKEFTEHGGSVPGWLTEKGQHLKTLLEEYFNN
jgi:hypothetical protein